MPSYSIIYEQPKFIQNSIAAFWYRNSLNFSFVLQFCSYYIEAKANFKETGNNGKYLKTSINFC